jgi:hypothetical protein
MDSTIPVGICIKPDCNAERLVRGGIEHHGHFDTHVRSLAALQENLNFFPTLDHLIKAIDQNR